MGILFALDVNASDENNLWGLSVLIAYATGLLGFTGDSVVCVREKATRPEDSGWDEHRERGILGPVARDDTDLEVEAESDISHW